MSGAKLNPGDRDPSTQSRSKLFLRAVSLVIVGATSLILAGALLRAAGTMERELSVKLLGLALVLSALVSVNGAIQRRSPAKLRWSRPSQVVVAAASAIAAAVVLSSHVAEIPFALGAVVLFAVATLAIAMGSRSTRRMWTRE